MEIRVEKGPLKGLDYSVRLDVSQGGERAPEAGAMELSFKRKSWKCSVRS